MFYIVLVQCVSKKKTRLNARKKERKIEKKNPVALLHLYPDCTLPPHCGTRWFATWSCNQRLMKPQHLPHITFHFAASLQVQHFFSPAILFFVKLLWKIFILLFFNNFPRGKNIITCACQGFLSCGYASVWERIYVAK